MSGSKRFKDGAWRLTVAAPPGPDGRPRRLYRTVQAPNNRTGARQADQVLAALVTDVAQGRHAKTNVTVNELLDAWLAHITPTRAARTTEGYDSKTRLHVRPYLGQKRLDRLTAFDVDQLHSTLRARGLAEKSIRHVDTALHAALTHAVRWGWLAVNPMAAAERIDVAQPDIVVPTVAQVRATMQAAAADFAAVIHTAASTGHRRGSLLGLRWTDIDLDASHITFQRAIAHVPGQPLIVKSTKAKTVARATLEPALAVRLRNLRSMAVERALACGISLDPDAYVWSHQPSGDRPWHPTAVPKRWARSCAAAGVKGIRFHDLKHFAVTTMLADGIPVWQVAQRTGTSSATIERVYGHFIPGRDAGAAGLMDRLLG